MDNQNANGIKPWQWTVTAIVIIILVIIGVMVFSKKGVEAPVTGTDNQTASTTSNTANRIVMTDQNPGNVAFVSSVQVANSGWVVIQTSKAGKLGDVIGSTHVDAGINPGVKITLSQPMVDGGTYYAVLYSDNGSGKFDLVADKPLTNSNGDIIMSTFKAYASASSEIKG